MFELTAQQAEAISLLRDAKFDTDHGMPQELFLLVSSLIPLPNVDLLTVNEENQLLLARRNDPYYEKNWHIPGGCMRYNESFEQCVQSTAMREIGTEVSIEKLLTVKNVIRGPWPTLDYPRERGHNVAILFRCKLPDGFAIRNGSRTEDDDGYLRWFDRVPEDLSVVQHVYDDILKSWC